jgi:Sulfotransferase family
LFISHEYKAIFVHIQRTGGNSIQKTFEEHDPGLIETIPVDPSKNRTKHCFLADIKAAVDGAVFRDYTKFCVVRNPFERMVSWYFHFKDGGNKEDEGVKLTEASRALDLYHRGRKIVDRSKALSDFYTNLWIRLFQALKPGSAEEVALRFELIGGRVMSEINKNASNFGEFVRLPRQHQGGIFERLYANQIDYISCDGQVAADKILRFESLSQDFEALAAEIGFPGRLPHVNASSRDKQSYREHYDPGTRENIARRFERDCDYFGYTF